MICRVGRRTAAPRWLLTLTAAALLWASLPVAAGTGTASERDGRDERGRAAGAPTAPRTIIGPYRSEGQAPVAPGVVHDSGAFVTDTSAGPRVAHIVEVDPATADGTPKVVASIDEVVAAAPVTVIDDRVAPVAQRPTAQFILGSTIAEATAPVRVSWRAAHDGETSVVGYELMMATNHGRYVPVRLPTRDSLAVTLRLAQQQQYRFAVRAIDEAGNRSAWVESAVLAIAMIQETHRFVTADASWGAITAPAFLRGRLLRTGSAGQPLRATLDGAQFAWVGVRGPNRGRAEVRIDGVLVATVDLAAPTTTPRHVVYRRSLGPPGRHVVEIRSLDVPARSLVEVDAFLVVRNGTADPVIVGAGDIASCSRTSDTATAVVMDEVVGTVVTMGDNVYDNGTPTEFRECYEPTWGRVKARTRPTPGNHDYGTSGAAGYFGYFGAAAGTSSKSWYAYDLGSWRVYALDSDCSFIGGCGEGSPQLTWLRADLAANPRKCTIAMWHHARFSSGIHGNNPVSEPLFAALHAAGADVALTGHDHLYERFAPQTATGAADPATGIRQWIVGTGGNGLYPWSTVKPNSEVRHSTSYGVLKLTLRPGAYDWTFLPVEGDHDTDTGTARCH